MTNVQIDFDLTRKATLEDAEAIAKCYSVYGFQMVKLSPEMDRIKVQYDATRFQTADVEDWLVRLGVPIRRVPASAAAPTLA